MKNHPTKPRQILARKVTTQATGTTNSKGRSDSNGRQEGSGLRHIPPVEHNTHTGNKPRDGSEEGQNSKRIASSGSADKPTRDHA